MLTTSSSHGTFTKESYQASRKRTLQCRPGDAQAWCTQCMPILPSLCCSCTERACCRVLVHVAASFRCQRLAAATRSCLRQSIRILSSASPIFVLTSRVLTVRVQCFEIPGAGGISSARKGVMISPGRRVSHNHEQSHHRHRRSSSCVRPKLYTWLMEQVRAYKLRKFSGDGGFHLW